MPVDHIAADYRSSRLRVLLIWLAGGGLACLLALNGLPATLSGGVFFPADPDSFYHAHRIIDALVAPWQLEQFDPRIHAPEGSWVTWPWAYDTLMALLGHIAVFDFGVRQVLSVLAFVAPLWAFVNVALFLAIAGQLRLSLPLRLPAVLLYAGSPLMQMMHRAGMLDHHYVEHSFVLGMVLLGLRWFEQPDNPRRAAALGVLLGAAPAFHNGLFIIQLPVLAALGLRWLLGRPGHPRAAAAFALSLVAATLLFLLPSEPFRRLMFSFALQSWFHLFIAASTAIIALLFAQWPRSYCSALLIAVVAIVLAAGLSSQVAVGGEFLSGRLVDLKDMEEVRSFYSFVRAGDWRELVSLYGGTLLLLPFAVAWLLWRTARSWEDSAIFFACTALFGAVLMSFQLRLENYGSFAMFLLPFLAAERALQRWPRARIATLVVACLGAALAEMPVAGGLLGDTPLGGSYDYELTLPVYPALAAACRQAPGTVLADNADGHPIVYFTACSVIADNFVITRQHEEKLLEAERLLSLPLDQVLAQAPYVRYIYVRRNDNVYQSTCGRDCPENRGLRQLLFEDPARYPRLKLIAERDLPGRTPGSPPQPLARIFEVLPSGPHPASPAIGSN